MLSSGHSQSKDHTLKSLITLLLSATVLIGQVFVSEVERNPVGSESTSPGGKSHEYIELVNLSNDTLFVDSMILTDGVVEDRLISIEDDSLFLPGTVLLILDPDYIKLNHKSPLDIDTTALVCTINHTSLCGGLTTSDGFRIEYSGKTVAELRDSQNDDGKLQFTTFEGSETEEMTLSPQNFFLANEWRESISSPGKVRHLRDNRYYEYSLTSEQLILRVHSFGKPILGSVSVSGEIVHTGILSSGFSTDTVPIPENIKEFLLLIDTVTDTINLSKIRVLPNSIDISEITPRNDEWIELRNRSNEPLLLSGWKIANSEDTFAIPGEPIVQSGEYLVLSRYELPSPHLPIGNWFSLDNYRDTLFLISPWRVEDSVAWNYQNYTQWEDESLHRIEGTNGFTPTAFVLAEGSPGTESQLPTNATAITLSVPTTLFTPDGDGRDDSLLIDVTHPAHYSCHIRIFSVEGNEVNQFYLTGTHGSWNGSTFSGTTARRGAYVLLAEFTSSHGNNEMRRQGIALWR